MLEDHKPLLHMCQHGLVLMLPLVAVVFVIYSTTHPPPPTIAFNLQQLHPQSAPGLTFTQFSNPSITEAPLSAFHSHETIANYNENMNPSAYEPPPYDPGPSFYDVATDDLGYVMTSQPLKTDTSLDIIKQYNCCSCPG